MSIIFWSIIQQGCVFIPFHLKRIRCQKVLKIESKNCMFNRSNCDLKSQFAGIRTELLNPGTTISLHGAPVSAKEKGFKVVQLLLLFIKSGLRIPGFQ